MLLLDILARSPSQGMQQQLENGAVFVDDAGIAGSSIANSAVELLGAVQAPQSSTYDTNLANAMIGIIKLAVDGQPPKPNIASALVQMLQVI